MSEENLEKVRGGRVEETKEIYGYYPPTGFTLYVPLYKVYNDKTNEFVAKFYKKEEAEAYDKEINGKK